MEKFKDPEFRKEVYEYIIEQLYKMKSGSFKRLPFMCHIVAEKYMKELGGYKRAVQAMKSLTGRPKSFVTFYGQTVTPLNHILPELTRPHRGDEYTLWYDSDDITSRILNCEAALEKLKSKLP